MAVIQISKIQVRRGLQENLPQLASGEMGWSVDERRLWIGNGTLAEGAPEEGNTEILTSARDYSSFLTQIKSVFQGSESGYTSQTGPSVLSEVRRALQNKLDEQISFRDFITEDDINLNDYTTALQRAIDEIFPVTFYTVPGVRRQLHIPAGVYPITGTITIPPYATIKGDGPRSTIIKKIFGTDSLIRLRDSAGLIGEEVDTISNDKPFEVSVSDLTLQTDVDATIALLESCQYVKFSKVRFQGAVEVPSSEGDSTATVMIKELVDSVNKISFDQCEFVRSSYGIDINGDVSSVLINDSLFDTLYTGIRAEANIASPQGIKITNSQFDNITSSAIVSGDSSSIVSAYNYYKNVNSDENTSILYWATSNNYSIADIFDRTIEKSIISVGNVDQASLTQHITSGSAQSFPGGIVVLEDGTTANTSVVLPSRITSAIIDYKIERGIYNRIGTIKVSHEDGNDISIDDEYTESGDVGVILSFIGNTSASSSVLSYTTTAGDPAELKYTVRSFV